MIKKLSEEEIKATVEKIREKYKKIIKEFKKSNSLLEAFEDRYRRVLKTHIDLSAFLLGEIEAVEEIYKNEEKKQKEKALRLEARKSIREENSFADRILKENLEKIQKYDPAVINNKADEEIERLLGAVRTLLVEYWPVIILITKAIYKSSISKIFEDYYHQLIMNYDYKDCPPIAKFYKNALESLYITNSKRVENERFYIIKETAFLLHDILKSLKQLLEEDSEFLETNKIKMDSYDEKIKKFNSLTYKQAVILVINYINQIINDFRIKELKRE